MPLRPSRRIRPLRQPHSGAARGDQTGDELGVLPPGGYLLGLAAGQNDPVLTDDRSVPGSAHRQPVDKRLQDGAGQEQDPTDHAGRGACPIGDGDGNHDRKGSLCGPHQPADPGTATLQRPPHRVCHSHRQRCASLAPKRADGGRTPAVSDEQPSREEVQRQRSGGKAAPHTFQVASDQQGCDPVAELVELPQLLGEAVVQVPGCGPCHGKPLI